jgi:uncharacterized membrane protein
VHLNRKLLYIFLSAAVLLSFFAGGDWLFAQPEKSSLSLRLIPGDYNNGINPGEKKTIFLEVRNSGTSQINNIRFTATRPDGWTVTFQPGALNSLPSGGVQTINVDVTPDAGADRGSYQVTVLAEADETRNAVVAFFNIEKSSGIWLWTGVGIGVLVIVIFALIFFRYGRQ